jgi:hypothetical protein
MKMKYFVISKCRLVDKNIYLLPGTIFDPESEDYERSSRSLAAALKAGWVRKATDKDVEKVIKTSTKSEVVKPKSELAKGAALGAVDMKPESFADEVISGDAILKARDKRREEAATKTIPDVEVQTDSDDDISENTESEEKEKKSATTIKKEIEKKIRKKTSRKKKN